MAEVVRKAPPIRRVRRAACCSSAQGAGCEAHRRDVASAVNTALLPPDGALRLHVRRIHKQRRAARLGGHELRAMLSARGKRRAQAGPADLVALGEVIHMLNDALVLCCVMPPAGTVWLDAVWIMVACVEACTWSPCVGSAHERAAGAGGGAPQSTMKDVNSDHSILPSPLMSTCHSAEGAQSQARGHWAAEQHTCANISHSCATSSRSSTCGALRSCCKNARITWAASQDFLMFVHDAATIDARAAGICAQTRGASGRHHACQTPPAVR